MTSSVIIAYEGDLSDAPMKRQMLGCRNRESMRTSARKSESGDGDGGGGRNVII